MNKILLIGLCILMILFTVASAFAALSDNNVRYYASDDDSYYKDSVENKNGTLSGASYTSGGYSLGAYSFDSASSDYITIPAHSDITEAKNFSIRFWVQINTTTGDQVLANLKTASGDSIMVMNNNGGTLAAGVHTGSWTGVKSGAITTGWHHIVYTYDTSGNTGALYLDNASQSGSTNPNTAGSATDAFTIGARTDGTSTLEGEIDEFALFNKVLSASEANDAHSWFPYIPTATTPSFVAPTPTNNTHNDTQITINMTCDPGDTFYLYFDQNSDPITTVLDNTTTGNYTTNVSTEGQYYYKAQCYNLTLNKISSNTTTRTWFYDVTNPAITLNPNNAFNITNYSQVNQYNNLMPLNITFTDNVDLFAFSINVTKGGTVYWNITNESISGTNFTYTNSLNVTTWPSGTYNIELMTSDSHTDEKINSYRYETTSKAVIFDTYEGNNIIIESEDTATTRAFQKIDRYEFDFNFKDSITKQRVFHLKSDKPIIYRERSTFQGHFVVWNNGKGNWIDFEGVEGTPEIIKVSNYHYKVIFSNLGSYVRFKSIGGLNVLSANYTWYKGTEEHTTPKSYQNYPFTLSLNLTFDTNTMYDIDSQLVYNGTLYNVTETNDSNYFYFSKTLMAMNATNDIDFYWNLTLNQTNNAISKFNITDSHSIKSWTLTNCTAGNTSLNFTIYNEQYPSILETATVELEMLYWLDNQNKSINKTFSTQMAGKSGYLVCIESSDITLYTDLYMKYTVDDGFTHRYYLYNHTLTNVTQNIGIYNFNTTTDISNLKITARYSDNYLEYPNVLGKLQRRYPAEGVWRTVQMDQSGDSGLIFFNVEEEDTDYRIIFLTINNTVMKTTEDMKFVCTSGVCDVTFLLSEPSSSTTSLDLNLEYSYDNETGNVTVTWDEATGTSSTIRVLVTKDTATGVSTLCEETLTGAAGTIVCDLSAYSGAAFLEIASSNSPFVLQEGGWIDLVTAKLGKIVGVQESSFWAFIITLMLIGAALLSPVAAVMGAVFAMIVIGWLGIFTPLTMTMMIIFVAMAIAISFKLRW